jgi:hypothetical protein
MDAGTTEGHQNNREYNHNNATPKKSSKHGLPPHSVQLLSTYPQKKSTYACAW